MQSLACLMLKKFPMNLEVDISEEQLNDGRVIYRLRLGEGHAQIDVDRGIFLNDPDAVRFALEACTDALRFESQRIIYKELTELEKEEDE